MMRKSFAVVAAVFVLLTIVGTARQAAAKCCGCTSACYAVRSAVISEIKSSHDVTRDRVKSWIGTMTEAIVEALREQTAQLSQYSKLQIEAMERIADAQQTNQALRLRQEFRGKAEAEGRYDPDPNGCLTLERAGYGAGVAAEAGVPSNEDAVRKPPEDTPARRKGGVGYAVERVNIREDLKGKGVSTTDVQDWFDGRTIERGGPRAEGSAAIAQNIIDPMPPPDLTEHQKNTPANAVLDAKLDRVRVRHSLVKEAMAYVFGLREGKTAEGKTADVAIRNGATMKKFAEKGLYFKDLPSGAVSEMQALDVMTTYHHEPQPEEAAQRESQLTLRNYLKRVYEVGALNARINFLRLEVESRQLMVNATRLAAETPRPADQVSTP